MKRIKSILVYIILPLSIILISIFTWQILIIERNPLLLSIDYKNKYDEIQAYASLMGFILSFLSIIFVIYSIIEQRQYFEKNIEIKNEDEKKLRQDFLHFSKHYLTDIIKDTEDFSGNVENFYKEEQLNPLNSNFLKFTVNNNNQRFADIDNLQLFKSFTENISDGNSVYNDFLKFTDFYIELKKEVKSKYQNHINDKFLRKREIALKLNEIMDSCSKTIEKFREKHPDTFSKMNWHNLLNGFIGKYYEFIDPQEESDLLKIDNEVLKLFLEEGNEVRKEDGFPYDTQEIVLKVSSVRKLLHSLKLDCEMFSNEIENLSNTYLEKESTNFKDFKLLVERLTI